MNRLNKVANIVLLSIEFILAAIFLVIAIESFMKLYNLNTSDQIENLWFNTNLILGITSTLFQLFYSISFFPQLLPRLRSYKNIKIFYLTSAFLFGFTLIVSLIYNASFMDSIELRQFIKFPIVPPIIFSLVIIKMNFSDNRKYNMMFRILLIAAINIAIVGIWTILRY